EFQAAEAPTPNPQQRPTLLSAAFGPSFGEEVVAAPGEGGPRPVLRSNPDRPRRDPVTPSSDVYDLAGTNDGWAMVEAAANVVRDPEPQPEQQIAEQPQGSNDGKNMAQELYGQIFDLEIPGNPESQVFNTTNIRQVTFTNDGSVFDPMINGDGSLLYFSSTQHRPTSDIYVQQVNSRVVTRLTSDPAQDVMPSISPDGTRIAFASNRNGSWDIWVMPATGGKAIQITGDNSHDMHPSWSPDGRHLVFCRLGQSSGRWELWVADVFNTVNTQFIGYGLFPEWSPVAGTGINNADKILFQRSRERGARTFSVWTLDFNRRTLQAGNETQIATNPKSALINPAWSPDGERISYAAVPNPDKWIGDRNENSLPPRAGIWIVRIDGREEVPMTVGDSIDMMPAWAPTGQLYFVSDRSGAENLWAIDLAPAMLAATGGNPFEDGRTTARAPQQPAPQGRAPG
ncbi:MAG: DPP IV N-terminal domain-containing protein, partial [Planctomycetota bacterium]